MPSDVERIKDKIDVVDLIKSYVNLNPAGKNFKGLCPFHQEKTPSFMVSPERQIWHCFGCGEGGDLIKFVMKYENLDFPEALRFLADKAGIEIKTFSKGEQKIFDTLYEINEKSKHFFVEKLSKNKEALKYLEDRGLSKETIEEFELGYAPGGEELTKHLLQLGYKIDEIEKAGVSTKRSSGLYKDRFIKRIIFPIVSEIDRTVAFTGRVFTKDEVYENIPKYLNSPASPIYKKSKILYGFNKTKIHIKKKKAALVVEGNMDLLMSYQYGIKNIVAVSGTALTKQHLEKLRRITDTVILTFDNDQGGLRALEKSLDIFSKLDFHTKAVNLGKYKDPAEALIDDSSFFKKSLKEAKPAFERLINFYFSNKKPLSINRKKKIVRHVLSKIEKIDSKIEQDIWLSKLSEKSGVSETSLRGEMTNKNEKSTKKVNLNEKIDKTNNKSRYELVSERLITLAFTKEKFLTILKENQNIFPEKYRKVIDNPKNELAGLIDLKSSFISENVSDKDLEDEFTELIKSIKIEFLMNRSNELKKLKEKASTEKEKEELVARLDKIYKTINSLKNEDKKTY
ncbi:MAG: DNA primase [Candidatus Paceibacterota bacterium]